MNVRGGLKLQRERFWESLQNWKEAREAHGKIGIGVDFVTGLHHLTYENVCMCTTAQDFLARAYKKKQSKFLTVEEAAESPEGWGVVKASPVTVYEQSEDLLMYLPGPVDQTTLVLVVPAPHWYVAPSEAVRVCKPQNYLPQHSWKKETEWMLIVVSASTLRSAEKRALGFVTSVLRAYVASSKAVFVIKTENI